jgi:hypothetical protein
MGQNTKTHPCQIRKTQQITSEKPDPSAHLADHCFHSCFVKIIFLPDLSLERW